MMDVAERLRALEAGEVKLAAEVAPGVYAFGAKRPLGRIRAYSSAGLTPFAGRGLPNEFHLIGHVHVQAGRVTRIEGFNGGEGERWARAAHERAVAVTDLLAENAQVIPATPLRGCPHTGIR